LLHLKSRNANSFTQFGVGYDPHRTLLAFIHRLFSASNRRFNTDFMQPPFFGYVLMANTKKWRGVKGISVTGREGPYGCETSRPPHFLDNQLTDGGKVISLTCQLPFTPRKIHGTHLLGMSRPQGHSAAGRFRYIEKNPHHDSHQRPSGL
jgi:hypothetical protein